MAAMLSSQLNSLQCALFRTDEWFDEESWANALYSDNLEFFFQRSSLVSDVRINEVRSHTIGLHLLNWELHQSKSHKCRIHDDATNHNNQSSNHQDTNYLPTSREKRGFWKNERASTFEAISGTKYPENSTLRCMYLSIPQARETFSILVSQIDWMWGCEHGANEHGVVIGNEAIRTHVPEELQLDHRGNPKKLLERGTTSKAALEVITGLLEEHGQGGPCAEDDPSFTYHNSFLIADAIEVYVLISY